jgi:hypothetical protein
MSDARQMGTVAPKSVATLGLPETATPCELGRAVGKVPGVYGSSITNPEADHVVPCLHGFILRIRKWRLYPVRSMTFAVDTWETIAAKYNSI